MESIRFRCVSGCTNCCRQRGFVYLTETDLENAAAYLKMSAAEFEQKYVYRTRHLLRLRTPRRVPCPFLLDDACSIHPAKPTQCRTFPFWPELLELPMRWVKTASYCPGIGQGPLIQIQEARAIATEMIEAYPKTYS